LTSRTVYYLPDLGFQSEEITSRFPIANQIASQLLTLQGAIAHTDMPTESGSTKLLPFSQTFKYGYMAFRHSPFKEIFDERSVQLPLKRGDALFFNPALFHAAGNNDTTDVHRSANLLQISAAWSKPMEHVKRRKILVNCWQDIQRLRSEGGRPSKLSSIIQAIADGYSFPTNLDKDPPPSNGVSVSRGCRSTNGKVF
jgi:ectoine hydroxylase-related dioxygenase (phytanoyl-CoA dioxygenase family)